MLLSNCLISDKLLIAYTKLEMSLQSMNRITKFIHIRKEYEL